MGILQDPKVQWLKRRIFGKEDPNWLLKWTCILLFWWSLFIMLVMIGLAVVAMLHPPESATLENFNQFRQRGASYTIPYAGFHLLSIIAIMLMYRLKKSGLILYAISCACCVLFPLVRGFEFPMETLIFSLVATGLFAVHLGAMNKKERKSEERVEEEVEQTTEESQR